MTTEAGWEIVEHTADVGVRAWGPTPAAALSGAVLGMLSLVTPPERVRPQRTWSLSVSAPDPDLLLFNLLDEVLYLHHVEGLLAHEVTAETTAPPAGAGASRASWKAAALVRGEPLDHDRHRPGTEIKAVTLHGIGLRHQDGRWWARAIFDL